MAKFHRMCMVKGVRWIIRKTGKKKFVARANGYELIWSSNGISRKQIQRHMDVR